MFYIIALISVIGLFGSVMWWTSKNNKVLPSIAATVCIALFVGAWFTPQGKMYWLQLVASGKPGNWIVVDNSGGKTLRHWILEDSYVGSSDQSDGWKFNTNDGMSYVSGDAYVGRINRPLSEFLKDYRIRYNIPAEQTALD